MTGLATSSSPIPSSPSSWRSGSATSSATSRSRASPSVRSRARCSRVSPSASSPKCRSRAWRSPSCSSCSSSASAIRSGRSSSSPCSATGCGSLLLALVCTVTGLATAYTVSRFLGLDPGYSAGLLSGGLTQSAAMGTATEAVNRLPFPKRSGRSTSPTSRWPTRSATSSASSARSGSAASPRPSSLAPTSSRTRRPSRRSLASSQEKRDVLSGYRAFELRAFVVPPEAAVVGLTVGEAERRYRRRPLLRRPPPPRTARSSPPPTELVHRRPATSWPSAVGARR